MEGAMKNPRTLKFALMAILIAGTAVAMAAAMTVKDDPVKSVWTDVIPTIDGQDSDWTNPFFVEIDEGSVGYTFANDGRNLYVLMMIRNPEYKSTIDQTGVTLYFNAKGKKKKDYGVLFKKIVIKPDEYIARLEKQGPVSDEQKAGLRSKLGFYLYHHEVLGKKGVEAASEDGAQPAAFKYAPKGGMLVFEFLIPLQRSAEDRAGVGVVPGRNVVVGIEYGGLTDEMLKAKARQTGSANIASETIGANTSRIVGSTGGRASKRYTFWSEIKLAETAK
jgi:hypothetical protein